MPRRLAQPGIWVDIKEDLVKEEPTHERLLRALKEMQAQIEERVRPAAVQVVQSELDRLRVLFERHQDLLRDCLAHIDQSILSCRDHFKDYQQARAHLVMLSESLAGLGVETGQIPDDVPCESLHDMINARVKGLRMEGKI